MPTGLALSETPLVLDNDTFTHWRNEHGHVVRAIADYVKRLKTAPSLTSITVFEASFGVENSRVKGTISDEQADKYGG